MYRERKNYFIFLVIAGFILVSRAVSAVEFQPGVGVGFEHTNNARQVPDNIEEDLIAITYVGASIDDHEGSLIYNASTSINKQNYTKDTFDDQRNFNLAASSNWEMIKGRFNWIIDDRFTQRTINTLDTNTPDNLQDTNIFTFGADIKFPATARQSFRLTPTFNQFYFENSKTNNTQKSLSLNWNYQLFRLTSVGLNLSTRKIEYTEKGVLGLGLTDTSFTNMALVINGRRARSTFLVNLGVTNVKRGNSGEGSDGFTGNMNWENFFNANSSLNMSALTELTDTSNVALVASNNPTAGNVDDVQISTDVIRNTLVNVGYLRDDARLRSRLWTEYRKLTYELLPFDRTVNTYGLDFSFPLTQLLASNIYTTYSRTKLLDISRLDKQSTLGGNLSYKFSRKLKGLFDIKYRKKESTAVIRSFDETSVYVSLVYGFGDVQRPTRISEF